MRHRLTEYYILYIYIYIYRYSPSVRADIGRYASQHGVTAAAREFTRKLGVTVGISTVHSIKKAYIEKLKRCRDEGTTGVSYLPLNKRGRPFGISTVHSIKKAYIEKLKRCRDEGTTGVSYLPLNKRGRPLLLTDDLDRSVQRYLCKVRECGGVVTGRIALAAAKGIVTHYDKAMLSEFGSHLQLNLAWGYSLLKRMNFVQRKVTTSKSKRSVSSRCRNYS